MSKAGDSMGTRFFRATATWTIVLLLAPALVQLLSGPLHHRGWTGWEIGYLLTGWLGLFLPYAAFAGGLAVRRRGSPLPTMRDAGLVGVAAFLLLGFAAPWMEYQWESSKGLPVETRYPAGAETVGNLVALRDLVKEAGPTEFSYSVENPLQLPPSWITYLIHRPAASAVFAVLVALLGQITGFLTSGLPPGLRRNARWAAGLAISGLAFLAQAFGGEWVRLDPSNSGLAGAWVPLLAPGVLLGVLQLLVRRRSGSSTVRRPSASDD